MYLTYNFVYEFHGDFLYTLSAFTDKNQVFTVLQDFTQSG
jgi:hypothetical protein